MKTVRSFDRFDEEAEKEGLSLRRFSVEVGASVGQVGTPKHKAKVKQHQMRGGRSTPFRDGHEAGVWRGGV